MLHAGVSCCVYVVESATFSAQVLYVSVALSPHLQKGTTALFIAVGANNYNAVIKLIAKGANVNAQRVRKSQCPEVLHVV